MEQMQQAAYSAAGKVNASTPTTGTGTPLMLVVSYLLYTECALIILLSVPFHVPYRRELMLWLHNSPKLWQVRVVIVCVNAFLAVLLADTYLRLDKISAQITALQARHLNPNPMGATMPGAAATTGQILDASSTTGNLNDLYSSRFRGQRDFYVISFTLFCSTVLYQLHLLLIKLGKYRQERNDLRQRLFPNRYPQKNAAQQAADAVKHTVQEGVQSVKNAGSAVAGAVDAVVHGKAAAAEGPRAGREEVVVPAAVVAPVVVPTDDAGLTTRKGYVEAEL